MASDFSHSGYSVVGSVGAAPYLLPQGKLWYHMHIKDAVLYWR